MQTGYAVAGLILLIIVLVWCSATMSGDRGDEKFRGRGWGWRGRGRGWRGYGRWHNHSPYGAYYGAVPSFCDECAWRCRSGVPGACAECATLC